ncbi:hypothetical protein PybrP1_002410 [[Pythium] brassicae (nom. inval.)]|nr:hypothetical protein PybrP1_002410 [[Pythium] brassicae (nom. inval.)]
MSRYDETLRRWPLNERSGVNESPGADELAEVWRRLRRAGIKPIECRMGVMPRDLDRSRTAFVARTNAVDLRAADVRTAASDGARGGNGGGAPDGDGDRGEGAEVGEARRSPRALDRPRRVSLRESSRRLDRSDPEAHGEPRGDELGAVRGQSDVHGRASSAELADTADPNEVPAAAVIGCGSSPG